MKKQMLAKLVVLGMVAAMLPISALAVGEDPHTEDAYYDLTRPDRPKADAKKDTATETTTPAAVKVETTTDANGNVVATVEVAVQTSGTTATAALTADAVASLATQAADSDVVVLNVAASTSATEVVAEIPAAALADLATATGAALTVSSPVADITISNADLATVAADATTVQVSAKVEGDIVVLAVLADGEVADGINLTVALPAAEGATAYLVAADDTETAIEDAVFADGKLTITVVSGSRVRIG